MKQRSKSLVPSKPHRPASRAARAKVSKVVSPKIAGSGANRTERAAERRAAIVEAAMEEFVARGFAATRLDDIAKRAGVAKGTIYLHFKDKESMFEELIRTALVPLIGRMASPAPLHGSVREAVEGFAQMFIREIASTPRGDIVRLIMAEGPRFPAIADFYFREVVSRGIAGMRALIDLAITRGEIRNKELARYPQIMVAPALIAVIWQSLFSRHSPLDAADMLRVHLDLIFGERRAT
jgi:AcrR family transcriptional regulator